MRLSDTATSTVRRLDLCGDVAFAPRHTIDVHCLIVELIQCCYDSEPINQSENNSKPSQEETTSDNDWSLIADDCTSFYLTVVNELCITGGWLLVLLAVFFLLQLFL